MKVKKIYKILKYIGASIALFTLSSVLGQKNSIDYSPVNTAFADLPGGGGGGDVEGDGAGGGASASDSGGGVDGASDSGPGDGSCSA